MVELTEPHAEELVQRLQLLLYRRAVLDERDAGFASELVDRLLSGGPGIVLDVAQWARLERILGRPAIRSRRMRWRPCLAGTGGGDWPSLGEAGVSRARACRPSCLGSAPPRLQVRRHRREAASPPRRDVPRCERARTCHCKLPAAD